MLRTDDPAAGRAAWGVHAEKDYLITTVSAFDTHGTPFKDQLIRTDLPIGGSVKNLLFAVADNKRQTVSDISSLEVPFTGNDVRGLVGKFAAAVSDYNCFDPAQERFLASVNSELEITAPGLTFKHPGDVLSVFVSGDFLFTGGGKFINSSTTGFTYMWNTTTGTLERTFNHEKIVVSVFVSGDYLFTASSDYIVRKWNLSNGNLISRFLHHVPPRDLYVSGDQLFVGYIDGIVRMWNVSDGTLSGNIDDVIPHQNAPQHWVLPSKIFDHGGTGSWELGRPSI